VIAAGPAMNLLIAFVLLFILAFGIREPTSNVADIVHGSPAQGLLRPGDRLLAVDGRRGNEVVLANRINGHRCAGKQVDGCVAATPAHLLLKRHNKLVRLTVRPVYDSKLDRHRIGFGFATRPLNPSAGEAARLSAQFMWRVSTKTVSVVARLFDSQQRKQVSGVVGGYEVTRQAIQFDARRALTLLAVISLSLAVINLFPFLPLDGGHIFWSLVEKLRGRPVPFSVMERAGMVGFVLVIFIFFIGLSNDIGRLTGQGFQAR
jgi:regulator of sigma E protease